MHAKERDHDRSDLRALRARPLVARPREGGRHLRDARPPHPLHHLVGAPRRRAHAAPRWPESGWPLRPPSVAHGRHQACAQGGDHPEGGASRRLLDCAGHLRDDCVHRLRRDPLRPHGFDLRGRDPAAAHRLSGVGALRAGNRIDRHLRNRARRLGLGLDVPTPRRTSVECADDLLRDRHGALVRRGLPLRRFDVHLGDRHRAGAHLVRGHPAAVLPHLRHGDGRRDQPRPLRPS